MPKLWKTATSNAFSTTLNGSISAADVSITLTNVTGLQAPGILVIDAVDTNGTSTPSVREYISFTGISTNTLTGVTRNLGGSTAQAHNSNAVVQEVMDVDKWNDLITALANIMDSDGNIDTSKLVDASSAQTLTNKTLTSPTITNGSFTTPKIITALDDVNGAELIKSSPTVSAVNEITVTNSITGNAPQVAASGDDTNIHLDLRAKGNAVVKNQAVVQDDSSNSYITGSYEQFGWTYMVISSGSTGAKTVTFPVPFTNIKSLVVGLIGITTGAVSGIGSFTNTFAANGQTQGFGADSVTITGFNVSIKLSSNVGLATNIGFSWIARGN